MCAVVQRVSRASVTVDGRVVGAIGEPGLLVLVGVTHETPAKAAKLAAKVWGLRILAGEKSCSDTATPLLVVSQFTLYADMSKGAALPGRLLPLARSPRRWSAPWSPPLRALGAHVETGIFGAAMEISLVNDGPVTILLEA